MREAADSAKQVLEVKSDFADTCFHIRHTQYCASGHPINENLIFRLLLVFTVVLDGRKLYLSAVRCWAQLISYSFFSFFVGCCWKW